MTLSAVTVIIIIIIIITYILHLLYIARFQRLSMTDVWFADVDQMWLEFVVASSSGISERSTRRRTVPLVDNFPLMAWMSRLTPDGENPGTKTTAPHAPSQTYCSLVRIGTKDIKAQVCFYFIFYVCFCFFSSLFLCFFFHYFSCTLIRFT